jgi:hypothetical protein
VAPPAAAKGGLPCHRLFWAPGQSRIRSTVDPAEKPRATARFFLARAGRAASVFVMRPLPSPVFRFPATRVCRAILAALLLLSLAAAAATTRAGAAGDVRLKWQRVTSEHFTMLSATNKADSRDLLVRLEQLRAMFLNTLLKQRVRETPCTIVLFDTFSQFEPYRPLYNGKTKCVGGYHLPGLFESHFVLSNGNYESAAGTIIHEYMHTLTRAYAPGIPLWLNEGIAEVYETFTTTGDDIELGLAHAKHLRLLHATKWLPLEELLAVTHGSPHYNESDKKGVFYAQSWLFAHYLICGDFADKGALGRFINATLERGVTPAQAFEKAFGMDYKTMERALKKYTRSGKYGVRRAKIPAVPIARKITTAPADKTDAELALLYLKHRMRRDDGAAGPRLREILAAQPDNARAHIFLYEVLRSAATPKRPADGWPAATTPGERRARAALFQEAREHLLRAAECGSDNAAVHATLASDEFSRIDVGLRKPIKPDASARLRGWLDRAIALDPDYLDAYDTLALVEAFSETFREEKMPAIIEAVKTRRPPGRGWIGLAVLSWHAGGKERGAELLHDFIAAPRTGKPAARFAKAVLDECEGRAPQRNTRRNTAPPKTDE